MARRIAKSKPIRFDLLANAKDSLRQAVELLTWGDLGNDHSRLKHSITHVAHAIELLLKEKLCKTHEAFIWENVDRYPDLNARTVTVDTAIARLKSIANVFIPDRDVDELRSLRRTRNAIEHHKWETTEREAKVIVGSALGFAFSFGHEHLGVDLADELKRDDTWRVLIEQLSEFARAYRQRVEARLRAEGRFGACCDSCESLAVPLDGGSCEVCGHWQNADDV